MLSVPSFWVDCEVYNIRLKIASGNRRTGRSHSHIFAKKIWSAEQSITPYILSRETCSVP